MGVVHLCERGNGGHGVPTDVEPPGVVAFGMVSLPPGPVAQDCERALKLSHLGVGKLAVLHVAFLLAIMLAPGVAFASTYILYNDMGLNGATQVALYYLGYDVRPGGESGLSDQAITALFGDEYTNFLYFKNSLSNESNPFDTAVWTSSLDGFAFAFAVDAARADVEQAARDYPKQVENSGEIQDGMLPNQVNLYPITGYIHTGTQDIPESKIQQVIEGNVGPLIINNITPSIINEINARYCLLMYVSVGTGWGSGTETYGTRLIAAFSQEPISYTTEEIEVAAGYTKRLKITLQSTTDIYYNTSTQTMLQNDGNRYLGEKVWAFYNRSYFTNNGNNVEITSVRNATRALSIYGLYANVTSMQDTEPEPEPEPPTQPDVPTPDPPTLPDPPTTDPQPPTTDPQPPVTVYPPITWVQQPTGTDIIPYLVHIIDDIQALDTHIGEHCQHLRQALHDQIGWLADTLTDYLAWMVGELVDAIEDGIRRLQNQIDAVFDHWFNWIGQEIHDQLGWQAQYLVSALRVEFDRLSTILDDSVTRPINTWLRMIYGKLGGNGGAKPSPTTEPDTWLDWLHRVIDALLDMLGALVPSFGGALEQLKDIFPFSIPWDIAFCLGLLAQEPQTPVFDVPYPYGYRSGALVYASVRVDFTPWNGVALIIRRIMTVLFAYMLAWATPRLYNGINATGKE